MKGKSGKRRIFSRVLKIFIVLILILIVAAVLFFKELGDSYDKSMRAESLVLTSFADAEPMEVTLTAEDKEEDFLYLYNSLETGCPQAGIKVNGKSVLDRKDELLEAVKNTENNFEFYCAMHAIIASVPSCHTNIVTDAEMFKLFAEAFNAQNVILAENTSSCAAYWESFYQENLVEPDISTHVEFFYIGGKYIYSPAYSCLPEEYTGSELVSVNGIPADEYAVEKLYPSMIRYDACNKKWCRNRADFNTVSGEKAEVKIKKSDGTEETLNLYFSISDSSRFLMNYASVQMPEIYGECYSFEVHDNICYLKLNSFMNDDIYEIESKLSELDQDVPLIIDIRDNEGGMTENVTDYFYPLLYNTSAEFGQNIYVKKHGEISKPTYSVLWVLVNKLKIVNGKKINAPIDGSYYEWATKNHVQGGENPTRDIYILIGRNSFSATDMFARMAKGKDRTLLIGTNTGGESAVSNYYMDILPNSRLAYLYTPSFSINADGENNAIYGTAPDIYKELTAENYLLRCEMEESGQDPYTYENRLKWDNVLTETIEMINAE
ncbi:MAG: hypothetical protein K2N71_05960 [Oscillospiraceae bacterium]|nr:hypothetical protein [Oscillospiraceae bacterium]